MSPVTQADIEWVKTILRADECFTAEATVARLAAERGALVAVCKLACEVLASAPASGPATALAMLRAALAEAGVE